MIDGGISEKYEKTPKQEKNSAHHNMCYPMVN